MKIDSMYAFVFLIFEKSFASFCILSQNYLASDEVSEMETESLEKDIVLATFIQLH